MKRLRQWNRNMNIVKRPYGGMAVRSFFTRNQASVRKIYYKPVSERKKQYTILRVSGEPISFLDNRERISD